MASAFSGTLPASRLIETVSEIMPPRSTDFNLNRRANFGRARDPAMAMTTWGTNSRPYWVFDRS